MRTRIVTVGYTVQIEDDTVDGVAEVEVSGKTTAAYFDKSFGNWLPGDDAETTVLEFTAEDDGRDLMRFLDGNDEQAICDLALEQLEDDEEAQEEDAAEARAEMRREEAEERHQYGED